MKIRTDFVTNSSSYSSAEIMIDNPVLLEILKRYEEMTEYKFPFKIGSGEFQYAPPEDLEKLGFSITPALYFYEEESSTWEPPKKIDEIIEKIFEYMVDSFGYELDEDLENELKKEISERKDEINNAYGRIYWDFELNSNEFSDCEGYMTQSFKFTFDQKNGAKFHWIDTDDETEEVLYEELWINGKEIKKYRKDSS